MPEALHPELDPNLRFSRLAGWLLNLIFFLMAAIGGGGLILAFMDHRFLLPALGLTLVSWPGAWWLKRFQKKWRQDEDLKLRWGSHLLNETGARPMRMFFKNVIGWQGPLIEFEGLDHDSYLAGALQAGKFSYPNRRESEVEVYAAAGNPFLLYRWKGKLIFARRYDQNSLQRERRNQKKLFLLLFLLVSTLFAGGKCYLFYDLIQARQELSRARLSLNWPAARGRILTSDIREWQFKTRGGQIPYFAVELEYAYTVAGHRHTGCRLRYGYRGRQQRSAAEDLRRRYPAGAEVEVYHNPADPAEAVLEPGNLDPIRRRITSAWGGLIALGVTGLITLFLLWFFLIRRNLRELERVSRQLQN